MKNETHMRVKFWGVRGSTPTPSVENLGYGGNTSCVEVRSGDEILIIDGGSGIRNLGMQLLHESAGSPCQVSILMSHFHWDHIQGLPFFAPLYGDANEVTFYAAQPSERVHEILEGQMSEPYFPVSFDLLRARRRVEQASPGGFRCGAFMVYPFALNHPQGAHGYRIEANGSTFVYASDLEPGDARLDTLLRDNAQGAQLLLIDSQYTPEEYPSRRGWGHGTWLSATQAAIDAKASQLVLFHHDPGHSDQAMDNIVELAQRKFPCTFGARELCEFALD